MRLPLTVLDSSSDAPALRLTHNPDLTPEQAEYDRSVRALADTPYMDYPKGIGLETLVRCNAACDFCPYPTLDRKGDRMSDAVIEKFLDELGDIPDDVPVSVNPSRVNEPFLDKRVLPLLQELERRHANARIALFSNGSTFTEKLIEGLGTLERIILMNISFNDHREADYEKTMQIPYDRTVRNLDLLHEAFGAGVLTPPGIAVSRIGDGTDADRAFIEWCTDRWPRFQARVSPRVDWMGEVSLGWRSRPPKATCGQFFKMQILASGKAAFCGVDSTGDAGFGDLNGMHLLEIYNHPERRRLRERVLSRDEVPACGSCALLA
jgi:hypothetical protein